MTREKNVPLDESRILPPYWEQHPTDPRRSPVTEMLKAFLAKKITEAHAAFVAAEGYVERGKAYVELTSREDQWAEYFGSLPSMAEIGALA